MDGTGRGNRPRVRAIHPDRGGDGVEVALQSGGLRQYLTREFTADVQARLRERDDPSTFQVAVRLGDRPPGRIER